MNLMNLMNNNYYIYFITNKHNTVLYIGVTNNLPRRIYEHKRSMVDGFTKQYNVSKLIYTEHFSDIEEAIHREKQLKGWSRKKKNALINKSNPEWNELSVDCCQGDPSTGSG